MNRAIANFPNGKRYIMPDWIEVSQSVTLGDIDKFLPDVSPIKNTVIETYQVEGKPYIITVLAGKVSCSCPGFQFRHKCKHAEAFKNRIDLLMDVGTKPYKFSGATIRKV